jgi:hypothetical protein
MPAATPGCPTLVAPLGLLAGFFQAVAQDVLGVVGSPVVGQEALQRLSAWVD